MTFLVMISNKKNTTVWPTLKTRMPHVSRSSESRKGVDELNLAYSFMTLIFAYNHSKVGKHENTASAACILY